MDAGVERITQPDALNAVRYQARRVQWRSLITAVLLTALYLAVF
jgi:hypothetical protein